MCSPYMSFKKLVQKQRSCNLDNLSLVISASKTKNEKVRKAYLKFLFEYLKYVAEKKDGIYSLIQLTFKRLVFRDSMTFSRIFPPRIVMRKYNTCIYRLLLASLCFQLIRSLQIKSNRFSSILCKRFIPTKVTLYLFRPTDAAAYNQSNTSSYQQKAFQIDSSSFSKVLKRSRWRVQKCGTEGHQFDHTKYGGYRFFYTNFQDNDS